MSSMHEPLHGWRAPAVATATGQLCVGGLGMSPADLMELYKTIVEQAQDLGRPITSSPPSRSTTARVVETPHRPKAVWLPKRRRTNATVCQRLRIPWMSTMFVEERREQRRQPPGCSANASGGDV